MARACRFAGISRQAYYQRLKRLDAVEAGEARVLELVSRWRCRQPRIGTRKLHHLLREPLKDAGFSMGRDKLFAVLRRARMLVAPQRAYHKTTYSSHRYYCHPNLLWQGKEKLLHPTGPEQVWVADITYLQTQGKMAYVSLVTDAWSRKIVGYHVHDSLQAEAVSQSLLMALRGRNTRQPLIHHSDRGAQYCGRVYQAIHRKHGLQCSMTDGYDCYQNGLAERINGILKTEFLTRRPRDLAQARQMVRQSVQIYNEERPHHSLQYQTPAAVHRQI